MSTVILLGAGASHGSIDCYPSVPPLGNGVFAALRRLGGVAASVEPAIRGIFEVDFETGMVAFWEAREQDVAAFLREMAVYFAQFETRQRNTYIRLIAAIRNGRSPATLATTNYDLLIESAASRVGMRVAYNQRPAPFNQLALTKIHGSCNFLPDARPDQYVRATFKNMRDSSRINLPIRVAESAKEVVDFCRAHDSLAPAIAVYAPGKPVLYSRRVVLEQQEQWQREAELATVIYIIGLRVLPEDEHIWGTLARVQGRLEYVGFEPDRFLSWAAENRESRPNNVLGREFDESIPAIAAQLRS